MADYRLIIDIKDVAEGDATLMADQIHSEYGESFDAKLGEFKISVSKVEGSGATFDTGWVPTE